MQPKKILYSQEARQKILTGAEKLAKAVKTTMGSNGRNVLIRGKLEHIVTKDGKSVLSRKNTVTKDGKTVAKDVVLEDPFEDIGAQLVNEAAANTDEEASDGPQPLYSKVLTPNGFVRMGDLNVGDSICGTNGSLQSVVGVYPKGQKEIYEVKLTDGRVVECCENHVWSVTTNYGSVKTMTAKEMINSGNLDKKGCDGSRKTYYFLPKTIAEFEERELAIDPYFIGTLIGDGSLSGGGRSTIALSLGEAKHHIIDKIVLPKGMTVKVTHCTDKNYYRVSFHNNKILREKLQEIGLYGTKSRTKFIPKEYLYSGIQQRKSLLQGLIDTDGHINTRGLFEFSTVSEQLAFDFQELCRGLGISINTSLCTNRGEDAYSNTPVYRIVQLKGYKYGDAIDTIEPTGRYTEMQCIKVSNPDNLYITDDYVVTHNTTTATVLAYAIMKEGYKKIKKGANAIAMKRGIELAVEDVKNILEKVSQPVKEDQLQSIATISSQDPEIGKVVSEVMQQVGEDGIVTVEEQSESGISKEYTEGMLVDNGYIVPHFITDHHNSTCVLEDCPVLITDQKIMRFAQVLPLLEELAKNGTRKIAVFCETMDGGALASFISNVIEHKMEAVVVRAPLYDDYRRDILEDIAVMTKGQARIKEYGRNVEDTKPEHLGYARRIVVSKEETIIVDGGGTKEDIEKRIATIKNDIETADKDFDSELMQKRIARMAGGVGVIRVGAFSEIERLEKHHRVEDAIGATRSAWSEGVIPGSGRVYLTALNKMTVFSQNKDEQLGIDIVKNALVYPAQQILENCGEHKKLLRDIQSSPDTHGYNGNTRKIENLIKAKVVDPKKVVRVALENAASVASMFLTLECVMAEIEEDPDGVPYARNAKDAFRKMRK